MAAIDVLIRGAKIIDGTGNPWFYGEVALQGERIAGITPPGGIDPEQAHEVVDATGMVVCPGFIDIQSHSIAPLMLDGRSLSKITQGVTTEIMGEGWTPAPFGGKLETPIGFKVFADRLPQWVEQARTWHRFRHWLEAMMAHGVSPNIGSFLGGGTLRQYVKGMEMGPPSPEELDQMRRLTAEAMEDGAFGVSYALIYPPDAYTETAELIEVCKVVRRYHGLYITHIRSEADEIFAALEEAFTIGRQANLPVEIYHLKASGRRNWPKMPQVIAMIEQARAEGLDVTADMYPYTASGTGLTSVLPPWAAAEGKLFDNLRDPEMRARIKEAALHPDGSWEAMVDLDGTDGVMPIGFQKPENLQYRGKRLSEIAAMRGQDWVDTVFDLLLSEEQRISTIYFSMSEENVRLQLQQPWIKISTDAGGFDPVWGQEMGPVHPRAYGTYPRVLGKYVREEGVIPLEEAIRKMSSAVADRLGIRDRGLLRPGMYADVVIFDPETIRDRATFTEPHQLSTGVREVWVNGTRVLKNGVHTGATPGKIVQGQGASTSV
ncbi:MAG: D-aminoacylase [Nitrospinota bacterium]|nr:MAG: D-aminoacylase [Nitrospinota bacterium]